MRRNNTFRWIIIIFAILTSFYFLYPTYRIETLSSEGREELEIKGTLPDLERKAIKRGLDLQGGMHLVLEIDLVKLFENLSVNQDDQFYAFLDLITESTARMEEDFYTIIDRLRQEENIQLERYYDPDRLDGRSLNEYFNDEAEDAINQALEVLRNRIDQFGVSEPTIQKVGNRRIIIELPGVQDIQRAKELIGKTAQLEFTLFQDSETTNLVFERINNYLKRKQPNIDTTFSVPEDSASLAATEPERSPRVDTVVTLTDLFGETISSETENDTAGQDNVIVDEQIFDENPFYALFTDLRSIGRALGVLEKNKNAMDRILEIPDVQKLIPRDGRFLWSNEPELIQGQYYYELYFLRKEPELTGEVLTDAYVDIGGGYSATSAGQPIVAMSMDRDGARVWSRVTGAHIGDRIAIVLDEKVYSAPVVRSKITGGNSVIEGIGNMDEAKDLSIVLRAGALPAPVHIIEERTVGPSLGEDSIRKGSWSAVIGMLLVLIFMIVYYKISGIIAIFALVLNIIFIMAILAGFHATLTLPGIAGIILTIGMAVDANVLIFERIREELRVGKTIRAAIDSGYARAFRTILDANVTTFLTAVVLYQFGTGPIRGFALTLMIGIICSMFTAIVVTRCIFDYITSRYVIRQLSI